MRSGKLAFAPDVLRWCSIAWMRCAGVWACWQRIGRALGGIPFVWVAAATLLCGTGCSPCRQLTAWRQDSVRVVSSVRVEERLVPDTVWIEIPALSDRERVRDTVSRLENEFARSVARIYPDGTLGHELRTLPRQQAAVVQRREVLTLRTDTVCVDRVRRDVVEVARPLTWWQQTQMRGFWLLAALTALWLARRLRRV